MDDEHLHDDDTGTKHGVPAGAAQEEATGLPDSGRHQSETAPVHGDPGDGKAGKDRAKDI